MQDPRAMSDLQDVPNMRRPRNVLDLSHIPEAQDLHRFQVAQLLYRSQGM